MKKAVIATIIAFLTFHGVAAACTILNRHEVQSGDSKSIEGVCSNNSLPITCNFAKGEGITCAGPGGSYSGADLDTLIFSACGCSAQDEKEMREKNKL